MPDVDRERAWLLTVDGAPQSYVDLAEPAHLEFEYARRLGHLLDTVAEPGHPLDVLHLGGGALALPRYVAATRPGSRQTVIEADRGLLAFVREQLPLPERSGIDARCADARVWLEAAPAGSADILIADVFAGSRVPAHLTSVEYVRQAARVLRPEGRYAANLADRAPFDFLRTQIATLGSVFQHVRLVAEPAVLRGRRFGNVLLIASRNELPVQPLARRCAADAFPARVEPAATLEGLFGRAEPVTDSDSRPSPPPPEGAFSIG